MGARLTPRQIRELGATSLAVLAALRESPDMPLKALPDVVGCCRASTFRAVCKLRAAGLIPGKKSHR